VEITKSQLHSLLQTCYFDSIDRGDADRAVQAFTDDVAWSHNQVWEHHGHMRNRTDVFEGRKEVRDFLAARIADMQVEGIRHQVKRVIVQGREGAFRAEVVGVTGENMRFFGWVELSDGKISRYIVGPQP
jgi:ketosteroid isomerase-like protein